MTPHFPPTHAIVSPALQQSAFFVHALPDSAQHALERESQFSPEQQLWPPSSQAAPSDLHAPASGGGAAAVQASTAAASGGHFVSGAKPFTHRSSLATAFAPQTNSVSNREWQAAAVFLRASTHWSRHWLSPQSPQ